MSVLRIGVSLGVIREPIPTESSVSSISFSSSFDNQITLPVGFLGEEHSNGSHNLVNNKVDKTVGDVKPDP